jgi:hypothetical protein
MTQLDLLPNLPMTTPDERYTAPLSTQTLPSGKVVYTSALPIPVPVDPMNDYTLTSNENQRMDIIANNIYGSQLNWWIIAQANGVVNGSTLVPPGIQLFIPQNPISTSS